jgi:hypothetical protein
MAFLNKLTIARKAADKAVAAVADNAAKVDDGIAKAAKAVDQRTGGKHTAKVDKAAGAAKGLVGKAEDRRSGRKPRPDPDGRT